MYEEIQNPANSLINEMERYFEWPKWMLLSEKLFLFVGVADDHMTVAERLHIRPIHLNELLECPCLHPLSTNDREMVLQQYKSLFLKAIFITQCIRNSNLELFF